MEIPKKVTIGEKYGPAMGVKTAEEAREYFEACVRHNMSFGNTREEAEKTERRNIGYYTGYYSAETAQRVMSLFGVVHPIFGASQPTAEEALKAGIELGQKAGR